MRRKSINEIFRLIYAERLFDERVSQSGLPDYIENLIATWRFGMRKTVNRLTELLFQDIGICWRYGRAIRKPTLLQTFRSLGT